MDETTPIETIVEPSADYTDQLDQIIQQNAQVIDYLDHMYKLQHAEADALAFQNGVIGLVGLLVVIVVGIYIVRS